MSERFPRQSALTRRFRLGAPRSFTPLRDGRAYFLRSDGGRDPVNNLWLTERGVERCVVRVDELSAGLGAELGADGNVPEAELARRERMRETSSGITDYSVDEAGRRVAFALNGDLWIWDEASGARAVEGAEAVIDPQLSPSGERIAWVSHGRLWCTDVTGGELRALTPEESSSTVTWGLADHVSAEELDRDHGYWWSPTSDAMLVQRTDEARVSQWWISDPARPEREPRPVRYPAAGTPNAEVRLYFVTLKGTIAEVELNVEVDPINEYLATVRWSEGAAIVTTLDRSQRLRRVYEFDPGSATLHRVGIDEDPCWIDVVPGAPRRDSRGRLVDVESGMLTVDGEPVTPRDFTVTGLLSADERLITGTWDPVAHVVARVVPEGHLEPLSPLDAWSHASAAHGTRVVSTTDWNTMGSRFAVQHGDESWPVVSHAEQPCVEPRPHLILAGPDALRTVVLLPSGESHESLPVLMLPYAGPHAQRVVAARGAYAEAQWLADQGFAVVICDGRGTPGRGPEWERRVHGDLATGVLEDQVVALHAAAAEFGQLDLGRVGISGWSFGGYLAALAVIERPDVFHAAVAGAPVTDWRLYDTAYTERYLGLPDENPEAYARTSLLERAHKLTRPLMLIHGLADDNVVAAHTLQLSSALLAAGREHTVLPLSGVTHITPQEVVAENLLHLEAQFFATHLH